MQGTMTRDEMLQLHPGDLLYLCCYPVDGCATCFDTFGIVTKIIPWDVADPPHYDVGVQVLWHNYLNLGNKESVYPCDNPRDDFVLVCKSSGV